MDWHTHILNNIHLVIVVNYTSSFEREGLTNYWQSLVRWLFMY